MSKDRNNALNEVKYKTKALNRSKDKGLINRDSGASIAMKGEGSTSVASGKYAQIKLDKEAGLINQISLQSNTITVQKHLKANDITVNNHKLNSQLWELTDFKQVNETAIGGLTVTGTVLVKTWEPTLQKWVMIRRQVRTPIFSNLLNVPSTPEQMQIDENIGKDIKQYKIQTDNNEEE
jgi:hypothetical protein